LAADSNYLAATSDAKTFAINSSQVNVPPSATFNYPTTNIRVGTSFTISLTNPIDPDTASGFTYAFDVGGGYGAYGSANSRIVVPSVVGPIIVKARINDNQGGITEYTGTVNIVIATSSAFILNPTASGAVNASGNANINLVNGIYVYSSSPSAISASGNAIINVGLAVQVVGGISKSGNAQVTKTGTPASTSDPLAVLSAPSMTGLANFGSVSVSGNTTRTLNPGVYSAIQLSGNAKVTMNPGVYIIKGGGFTVSGNAAVSGTGITIFNAGSNYNVTTDGGSFGGVAFSGSGNVNLNPPTTGPYAGVLVYQSRVNTRALSIGGNANLKTTGIIYAANAQLTLSGNGSLDDTLVVNTLVVSGNISLTQMADGVGGQIEIGGNANTLLAGDLNVFISSATGTFSPSMIDRIRDAIGSIDTLLVPYSVSVTEVSDLSLANVVITTSMTSANGGAANGVLGSYNPEANPVTITVLQGWDWYEGVDPLAIGGNQYDFQTLVTHELGHALGLGHAGSPTSAMYPLLAKGTTLRLLTVADLNIPDQPEGAEPMLAAGFVAKDANLEFSNQVASPLHSSQPSILDGVRSTSIAQPTFHDFEATRKAYLLIDGVRKESNESSFTRIDTPTNRSGLNSGLRTKSKVVDFKMCESAVDAALTELYDVERGY
jgi:hypothetical protein